MISKTGKRIITGFVLILFALLAILLIRYLNAKSILVVLRPNKFDSEVSFSINNKLYKTPATINGLEGNITISANYVGATPYNNSFKLSRFEEKTIHLELPPTNPNNEALGEYNPGSDFNSVYEKSLVANPLIQYLPVFTDSYNINYDINENSDKVVYYIETNDRDTSIIASTLKEVQKYISQKGINPDAIKFEWRNKTL